MGGDSIGHGEKVVHAHLEWTEIARRYGKQKWQEYIAF
jgi:hypothetical protein